MAKKKNAPARVKTNAGVNPMGSPKKSTVSQGLKIAGTGGITKQEFKNIAETTGKSSGALVKRLDKINQNLKAKDQVGINLNSGAANMLIREAGKTPTIFGAPSSFGTGRIGKALQEMIGTPGYTAPRNPQSGAPYGGSYAATPRTLLARGMDLMPSGRQTVRGIGKQYQGMPTSAATSAGEGTTIPTTSGSVEAAPSTTELPPELPISEEKVDPMMLGIGADLASWATGFKTKKSSRKMAGRSAQGYGSQRVNPATVNLNVS